MNNMEMGSGMTRYRSAPSSYFASFCDDDDLEGLFNPRALSPETHRIFSRFMNSGQEKIEPKMEPEPEVLPTSEYSLYQTPNSDAVSDNRILVATTKMQRVGAALIRHSSSPAGLFANINIENDFGAVGNFGGGNTANAEASFSSTSRIKSRMDFSMDPITEIGSKGVGENEAVDGQLEEDGGNSDYITGFPVNSWDDSPVLSDDFLKGLTDDDNKNFPNANAGDDQINGGGKRPKTLLSHHLSLPKSTMEKLLQDSVPCKIRAKRGCATHPRSIAERVRRTKISERMRKLQELVPNMEKQTNTSDMLDLAVDYIKDLQRKVTSLSDNREKCSCSCSAKQR